MTSTLPGHSYGKFHFRDRFRLMAAVALSVAFIAGVACGANPSRIELASDRFDLNTVAASDVFAAAVDAVSGLSSYSFEGTYET
ncbi:MAG: hypothetical protein IIB28_10175, partial [Chloroflexi bacterium]|nr:hypothetical protein [Chloroflexota bacterium]